MPVSPGAVSAGRTVQLLTPSDHAHTTVVSVRSASDRLEAPIECAGRLLRPTSLWLSGFPRVQNGTGEKLERFYVSLLAVKMPNGVHVIGCRFDLGPLSEGASAEGRVNFRNDRGTPLSHATLELRVESRDGWAFAIIPIATTIK